MKQNRNVFVLVIGLLMITSALFADLSDNFKPLLIDIKGWDAETVDGASVNMGGMKMINATRSYSDGDKTLDLTLIAGSNMLVEGHTQMSDMETDEAKVETGKIDGFEVIQGYDKKETNGYIIVNLVKKTSEGALFLFAYENISPQMALELAKKFDWKKMKAKASGLIN